MGRLTRAWTIAGRYLPTRPWIRIFLLAYGCAAVFYGVASLRNQIPDAAVFMDARAHPVAASIAALDQGNPPLWAVGHDACGPAAGCPTAPADDQGIFLFLPLAGHLLHIQDPLLLIKWFQIVLTAFLLFLYPIAFYEIFGSIIVALAAPFALLAKLSFLENNEVYFAMAWAVLVGLPVVFALHRKTIAKARVFLVLVVMAAALASTIRLHAGLPILVAAIVSIWLAGESLRKRLALTLLLLVAYFPVVAIPEGVARYRDAVTGVPYTQVVEGQHGIWHSVYIGLGYLPNPYGITFSDSSGDVAAHKANPNVAFGTRLYQDTMREIVLDLLRRDPGFFAANVSAKAGAASVAAIDLIGPIGIAIPVLFFVGRQRRRMREFLLIALPVLAMTLAVPVLYVPFPQYEVGWLGAVGVVWMVGAGWLVSEVTAGGAFVLTHRHATALWLAALRDRIRLWLRRPIGIGITAVLVMLIVVGSVAAYRALDRARLIGYYSQQSAGLVPEGELQVHPLKSWAFNAGLPPDWSTFAGVTTARATGGVSVKTNVEPLDYQMWSAPQRLGPGHYAIVVGGRITEGGIYVGALDLQGSRWLNTKYYWFGEDYDAGKMTVEFDLYAADEVRIVLSNWSPDRRSSGWLISDIKLGTAPREPIN